MKTISNIALMLFLSFFCNLSFAKDKETAQEKGLKTINRETAEAHIGFLADDALCGREAGTDNARIAGNYIASYLKSLGLKPLFSDCFQPFEAYCAERQQRKRFQVNPDSIAELKKDVHQRLSLRNVLFKIDGRRTNEYVIVGAHYDHLGYDPNLEGDKIYNGADDNASGVAAVLQIARAFVATSVQPERTVVFALWDAEEKGCLGSQYFVQSFAEIDNVKAYMNFDMIGRNNKEDRPMQFVYFYTASHPDFEEMLKNYNTKYNLNLDPDYNAWDNPVGGSDNSSFARKNIPIIWYHTNGHTDYHKPTDHTDKINREKTVGITKAAFLSLWNLAN